MDWRGGQPPETGAQKCGLDLRKQHRPKNQGKARENTPGELFVQKEDSADAAEYGLQGETAPTVTAAVARARELARAEDMIYIGGSTFVVAEFL